MLYWRLFSKTPWFRRLLIVLLLFITIWTFGFSFAQVFQCHPISVAWNIPEMYLAPYCYSFLKFYIALPVTDIITDIVVLITPMYLVWTLHLPRKQKLAVMGMFLLGAL